MTNKLKKLALAGTSAVATLAASAQMVAAANTDVVINPGEGFATDIGNVIEFALRVVMVLALLLVLGFLVIGGIEWITSGGDKGKTEGARNKITAAVIGLIVLASSYAILILMLRFLGFSSLTNAINYVRPINEGQADQESGEVINP